MPSRDPHRFFESVLTVYKLVETGQRDAFEAMKFCLPLAVARPLHDSQPVSRRRKSCAVLPMARQGVSQPSYAVASHPCGGRACKPLAQKSDSLLERSLRNQGGTAQKLWLHRKTNSLLGGERFDRIDLLQCKFRLAPIEVKHRGVLQD